MEDTIYWVWADKEGNVHKNSEDVCCEDMGDTYDMDAAEDKVDSLIMDFSKKDDVFLVAVWDSAEWNKWENDYYCDARGRKLEEKLLEFLGGNKDVCDKVMEVLEEEGYYEVEE